MRVGVWKGLAIGAAAAVTAVFVTLLALHTPWARTRILSWATGFAGRYDLSLQAGTLDYNALTRRATMTNVRLAAVGHEEAPFFAARRVEVRLPWRAYAGHFAIDRLGIDDGTVAIVRDARGVTNLPPGDGGPGPTEPRRLDVHGLGLHGFDVTYVDHLHHVDLHVPGIDVDVTNRGPGAAGNVAVGGRTALRVGDRTLNLAPFDTHLAFDGSGVALDGVHLSAAEVDLVVRGRVTRTLDSPTLDLTIDGTVNLAAAATWIAPPVAVDGTVRITGTLLGPADGVVLDLAMSGAGISVGIERDLRLDGPLHVTVDAATSTGVALTPASGGSLRASFTVPFNERSSTARVEWKGLDAFSAFRIGGVQPLAIGSTIDGSLVFEGGPSHRLTVTNRATARAARGRAPVSGTLAGSLVGDTWTLNQAHQTNGFGVDGRLEGVLRTDPFEATTIGGGANARVTDLDDASRSLAPLGVTVPDLVRAMRGGVDVPMVLSGTVGNLVVRARVATEALDVPSIGVVHGGAMVEADARHVLVSTIDLTRGTASITGGVTVDLSTRAIDGALRLEAPDARDLQAALPEAWRVSGPLRADGTLGGTIEAFVLDSTIQGSSLRIGDQPVDRAIVTARVTEDAIDVSSVELHEGTGHLEGRVRYAWGDGAYTASLKGQGLSWTGTLVNEHDTRATFAMAFDGSGTTAQPGGSGRIDFSVSGGAAGALAGTGDITMDLAGDQARLVARAPALGALVTATVATAAPYEYRAVAAFNRVDLAPLAAIVDARAGEVRGLVSVTATASGALSGDTAPIVLANLQDLDAGVGSVPVTLASPAHLSYRDGRFTVDSLTARVGSGTLRASGEWSSSLDGNLQGTFEGSLQDALRLGRAFGAPNSVDATGALNVTFASNGTRAGTQATAAIRSGTLARTGKPPVLIGLEADASLDGESLTMARLAGRVSSGDLTGEFSVSANAAVPGFDIAEVTGALAIDTAAFILSGVPVAQQRPSRIDMAQGLVSLSDVTWVVADNPLTLSGSIDLSSGRADPLDVAVKGRIDLRALSAFSSSVAFDGEADLDARITGSTNAPAVTGRILLDGGEIAIADPRVLVSELSGPIVLSGQTITFDGIEGLANGGKISVGGALTLAGLQVAGGAVTVTATGVAMEVPKGLRSEIDGLVTLTLDPKAPALTGDVRVVRGAYTDTISLAALARKSPAPARPAADSPYIDRVRLNLTVTTTDDVAVDNNYGRFGAGAALRVVGTLAEPGMTGRVTMREAGRIYLAGRTFRITRGDISFTDLRRIQPEFNIAATAQLGSDDVTMTLTGTLERPSIELTSEDGSKTSGELAAEIVGGSGAGGGALTLLSADVLGLTGRAMGLDALRVERGDYTDPDFREDPSLVAGDTDPASRLTISKRLSDQVEFTVSQNLRESGNTTVIVSYFPIPNVELRALSRDNSTLGFGVRHQLTFGGSAAQAPSVRAARPTLTSMTFAGTTATAERDARTRLRIKPGEPFEYLDLQRDIDAIREGLHGQGRFEARVRVKRVDTDDGRGVSLEFRVDPGPLTTLIVRGIELPAAELAALRAAWTQSVFDQFLIDDVTTRVRKYLVTTGTLASVVVGTLDRPSPDAKRLRIDVTSGAPISAREIRFTGNAALDAVRLKQEVAAAGLDVEAWINPTAVAGAVQSAYREAGFLKVEVSAGPLDIDGTVGVLPVRIVEGAQARVTHLKWTGVADSRAVVVTEAAKLTVPSVYISASVDESRRRVEQRYRADGFNTAAVDIEREVADDESVTLTFHVAEGPQQLLREVATDGANRTHPAVIADALRLSVGKPVVLDDWSQARKRLYDTNVFRQVDVEAVSAGEAADGIQPMRAQVTVQEFPTWALRYGFQLEGENTPTIEEFATKENFGVVADLKNQSLFGRALTFGTFAQYQYDQQEANVFLATSRLFGWRARSLLYTFAKRERLRDDANEVFALADQVGVSAEQRWRTKGFQIVYGYRFEHNHTYDPEPSPFDPFPLDVGVNLGRVTAALLLDRRDDPLGPRKGTFSSASWEQGESWLGSDVRNRKVLLQQFYFAPVLPGLVLASRAQTGLVFGPDELLPSDRFRAGGATSVRGYGEDSLGPYNIFGVPEGGETMVVLNQEARFTVWKWLGGVAFVDAGNVTHKDKSFAWSDMKVGYGAGLRLSTPVGLLRADVGIPASKLTPVSPRSTNTLEGARWYVGIGHIF